MGIFSNLSTAKPLADANYIRPGSYLVRLDQLKQGKTRKSIDFAAIESTIIHVIDNLNNTGHRLGESICHFLSKGGAGADYFDSEVCTFLSRIAGVPFDEVKAEAEASAELAFGPEQPFAGIIAHVTARTITTKEGHNFTKVAWQRAVPYSEALLMLTDEEKESFYKDGLLEKLAAQEVAAAKKYLPC
jgi:hypothetical protein